MKIWWQYKLFEIWVWFGHRFVGWNTITLHNSKDGERVLGVTFGETEEGQIEHDQEMIKEGYARSDRDTRRGE